MNRTRLIPATLALLLSVLPAGDGQAHEFWLAPARHDVAPRVPVAIGALAGTGFRGEWKPWSPGRVVRFVARTDRVIDLARGPRTGETAWLQFAPADAGGAMLAYESNWVPIELPAAEFETYLIEEGLAGPLAARRAARTTTPGRERYRRCAKAWLAGNDAARATTPLGLSLEIVLLSSPGSGSVVRVRVLRNGRPLAGARVRAWRTALAADGASSDPVKRDSSAVAAQVRTDARGEALVPCAQPGEWLLSVVAMERSRDRAVADWESTWSSLTFARRPAAGVTAATTPGLPGAGAATGGRAGGGRARMRAVANRP